MPKSDSLLAWSLLFPLSEHCMDVFSKWAIQLVGSGTWHTCCSSTHHPAVHKDPAAIHPASVCLLTSASISWPLLQSSPVQSSPVQSSSPLQSSPRNLRLRSYFVAIFCFCFIFSCQGSPGPCSSVKLLILEYHHLPASETIPQASTYILQ